MVFRGSSRQAVASSVVLRLRLLRLRLLEPFLVDDAVSSAWSIFLLLSKDVPLLEPVEGVHGVEGVEGVEGVDGVEGTQGELSEPGVEACERGG